MVHYLMDGENCRPITVEMICGCPGDENKNCSGNCGGCRHGKATMTIEECLYVLRKSGCDRIRNGGMLKNG